MNYIVSNVYKIRYFLYTHAQFQYILYIFIKNKLYVFYKEHINIYY